MVRSATATIHRQRQGGVSLESSNDPRLLIGIGPNPQAESVTVTWPSGRVSTLENVAADQTHEIVEPAEPDAEQALFRLNQPDQAGTDAPEPPTS